MTVRTLREAWLVAGLLAIGVALPLGIYAIAGVLDVPYSDEFTFRRTALDLFETGELRLGGWAIMTFVGQLLAVQPILALSGGETWAFPVTAAAFMIIAVVAGYALARQFLEPGPAAFAVLGLLLFPGVLLASPTFMTDIPAMAAELACLALAVRALDAGGPGAIRGRSLAFALALAAGVFAFSIRQFGLAAPVAVLVATTAAWAASRRLPLPPDGRNEASTPWRGRWLVAGWGFALGTCLAIYLVTSSLPGQAAPRFHTPGTTDFELARRALATVALAVSPALAIAGTGWLRSRPWRNPWAIGGAAAGLLVAVALYFGELQSALADGLPALIVGNVLSAAGSTGSGAGAGTRPPLFVPPTWKLLNLLALAAVVAGLTLTGGYVASGVRVMRRAGLVRLLAWLGSPTGLLVTFCGLYLGGTLTFGVVSSLFDRYLWPLILPLGILLLSHPTAGRTLRARARDATSAPPGDVATSAPVGRFAGFLAWAVAATISAAFALASLALALNRAAFDAARWDLGRELVASGTPASQVDAGYEWVGSHADRIVVPPDREFRPGERWYHLIAVDFQVCAIVASSSLVEPGIELQEVRREAYRLLLVAGPPAPLYVYRTDRPGCS